MELIKNQTKTRFYSVFPTQKLFRVLKVIPNFIKAAGIQGFVQFDYLWLCVLIFRFAICTFS